MSYFCVIVYVAQAVTFDPLWSWEPPSVDDHPSHLTCGITAMTVHSWGGYVSANPSWRPRSPEVIGWGGVGWNETAASAQLSTPDRFHHRDGCRDASRAVTDFQTRRVTCCFRFHRRPGERLWRRGGTGTAPAGLLWSADPSLFHSLFIPTFSTADCRAVWLMPRSPSR